MTASGSPGTLKLKTNNADQCGNKFKYINDPPCLEWASQGLKYRKYVHLQSLSNDTEFHLKKQKCKYLASKRIANSHADSGSSVASIAKAQNG